MKELSKDELTIIDGGWSFAGCAGGVAVAYQSGLLSWATVAGGWVGTLAAAAVSCVVGSYLT